MSAHVDARNLWTNTVREAASLHGILLVDKPEGITSNDVVRVIKRMVKPAKVGHSGTLDPAATGLLVILIGVATRTLDHLNETRKCYHLMVKLGEETDSADRDGRVIRTSDPSHLTLNDIETALIPYSGVIDQIPPHFSAIKKEGVPIYKLARKGIFPQLAPRKVEIMSLVAGTWNCPFLELELTCSKGTYARSLARDIGNDLEVGARLERLRRTESGPFHVNQAVTLDEISETGPDLIRERLIGVSDSLSHIPDISMLPEEMNRLMRGSPILVQKSRFVSTSNQHRLFKVVSASGGLLILVNPEPQGQEIALRPVRVFNMLGTDL